jgi:ABC-type amino acid transport substrate-binding protein
VRTGSSTEAELRQAVARGGYQVDIVSFAKHAEGLVALENREIDAYFADQALLAGIMHGAGGASEIVLADRRFTNEFYGIAMKRGDSDLRLLVDRFLSRFYTTPEFSTLLAKHFGAQAAAIQTQIQAQAILE